MPPAPVLSYWQHLFDGTHALTINPALDRHRRAMILARTDGITQIAVTPEIARSAGLESRPSLTVDEVRAHLAHAGIALHDPDHLFYAPDTMVVRQSRNTRRLTVADEVAFATFHAAATPQDREDSFVELDHWAVYGCFIGDRLVSAASAYPWDGSMLVDMGVLTLPDVRGRGLARALVHALDRHARAEGRVLQYRCQVDNHASVALACSAGLIPFGTWQVMCGED